jgi:hypothetical protein
MNSGKSRVVPLPVVVVLVGLIGGVAATVLALLTFGVQATVSPDHLPLAVGADESSAAAALAQLTQNISAHGGDQVSWHVVNSRAEAENLLDAKQAYGAILFSPGPSGLSATVLLSGAVNPNATGIAEPILLGVAQGVGAHAQVVTIHPTSAAGRTLPLAATALLWLTALVANVVALVLAPRLRAGAALGRIAVVGVAAAAAAVGTGVVVGLAWLWDSTLPIDWQVAGFFGMAGLAFSLLQAAAVRWIGPAAIALLGPFYLMAPAVAGLPPELLNPTYRTLLWSWTPFRFSTEGVRSLMFLGSGAPDVQSAQLVLGAIALIGFVLIVVRRTSPRAKDMLVTATRSTTADSASSS